MAKKTNTELIETFLENYSGRTKESYGYELNVFDKFSESIGKNFSEIDKWDIAKFIKMVNERVDAPTTKQRIFSVIRTFFKWLATMDVVNVYSLPTIALPKITPVVDSENKSLTVLEVNAMSAIAYKKNTKYFALIAVLSCTGMRINEALNLNWNDIQLDDHGYHYVSIKRKRNKHQSIPFRADVWDALMRLRNNTPILPDDGSPIFTSRYRGQINRITPQGARKKLEEYAKLAGITKPFTPHWFRHTFCTQTQENGAPAHEVCNVAGHAKLEQTLRYTHAMMGRRVVEYVPYRFDAELFEREAK